MKLLELDLSAFGPFTGLKMDFSSPAAALHVVYGPNEAGKSTALRAVRGLLYGIPARTTDAHMHPPQNLRIGARIAGAGGALLSVVRRKGLRNTLLDASGNPVDEAALRQICGGVTEEVFATMFGLDHETLRQGGEALLEDRGEIGRSLLGAALGGTGLHQVLRELSAEADALFTPQAQKKPLNEALRLFNEAQKQARLPPTTSDVWNAQKKAVEDATAETQRLSRELRTLREQRLRLARAGRVLPLIAERAELSDKLATLAGTTRVPPSTTREREDAQRTIAESSAQEARLVSDIEALEAERARLHVPESMRTFADELAVRMPELERARGSHDKAALDLPRVRGQLDRAEAAARNVLLRLGKERLAKLLAERGAATESADPERVPLSALEALRLDSAAQARVAKIASRYPILIDKHAQLSADLGARRTKLGALSRRRAALPAARDPSLLARALAFVQREGDLDERVETAARSLERIDRSAQLELAALDLAGQALAVVAALPVPPVEVLQTFERRFADLGAAELRRAERAKLTTERAAALEAELEALRSTGNIPTEEDLAGARARRDERWSAVAGELLSPAARSASRKRVSAQELLTSFEQAQREADAIADRLRREAEQVSRHARLLADRRAAAGEEAVFEREREALSRLEREARAEWEQAWAPATTRPRAPAEMRGWLARHARLAALADQVAEARQEMDRCRRKRDEGRAALAGALAASGRALPEDASFAVLADEARRTLAIVEQAERERDEIGRGEAELGADVEALASQLAAAEEAVSTWKSTWADSARSLGLPPDAEPEEATATLSALAELFPLVDEAAGLTKRVEGIERDAEHFAKIVWAMLASHAPDLAATAARLDAASAAAAELHRRWQQARTDLVASEQLSRRITDKRAVLAEQRSRRVEAEATLRALLERACAADIPGLLEAEQKSRTLDELENRLRDLEDQLRAAGEGLGLPALSAETEGLTLDAVGAELERVEALIEETERALSVAQRSIGVMEAGVAEMETRSQAADAAAEAEQRLARVRDLAERWIRVRLAAAVLAREAERYRLENQGPVLARASELFSRLTLGAYQGLRAGWGDDDRAVLRCVRADGSEKGVETLSDGTRDQLYLALRIASLERHAVACGGEAMPLIVDDVLVHFDDDRARASLTALGELADTTQILFFTHHQRLVELAREAVPPGRLVEHRLG